MSALTFKRMLVDDEQAMNLDFLANFSRDVKGEPRLSADRAGDGGGGTVALRLRARALPRRQHSVLLVHIHPGCQHAECLQKQSLVNPNSFL